MLIKKFFLLVILAFISSQAYANERYWTGHTLRFELGASADFETLQKKYMRAWDQKKYGFLTIAEPFFEYGYEYGHTFNNGLYLSGGLSWTISYPRNFNEPREFTEPPISLWYIPLTYVQIGYAFSNNVLITAGMVYYWAVMTTLRVPLTEHVFLENKLILWMDRILGTGGFYGGGYDNIHLSTGLGYHF